MEKKLCEMSNGDYIRSLNDTELSQILKCPNEIGFQPFSGILEIVSGESSL